MNRKSILGALVSGALLSSQAFAANSVTVESKTVSPGAQAVTIGVRMANDLHLNGFAIPLRIRELTPGSFITHLALSWGGRADTVMTDVVINNQYATQGAWCQSFNLGFGDIVAR